MVRFAAAFLTVLSVIGGCASGRDGYAYLPPLVPPVYPQPQDRPPPRAANQGTLPPPIAAVGMESQAFPGPLGATVLPGPVFVPGPMVAPPPCPP